MNEHQLLAIEALNQMRGDDLERYDIQAARLTPESRAKEFGMSGKTFDELHESYRNRNRKIDEAIIWINEQT